MSIALRRPHNRHRGSLPRRGVLPLRRIGLDPKLHVRRQQQRRLRPRSRDAARSVRASGPAARSRAVSPPPQRMPPGSPRRALVARRIRRVHSQQRLTTTAWPPRRWATAAAWGRRGAGAILYTQRSRVLQQTATSTRGHRHKSGAALREIVRAQLHVLRASFRFRREVPARRSRGRVRWLNSIGMFFVRPQDRCRRGAPGRCDAPTPRAMFFVRGRRIVAPARAPRGRVQCATPAAMFFVAPPRNQVPARAHRGRVRCATGRSKGYGARLQSSVARQLWRVRTHEDRWRTHENRCTTHRSLRRARTHEDSLRDPRSLRNAPESENDGGRDVSRRKRRRELMVGACSLRGSVCRPLMSIYDGTRVS